MKKLLYLLTAVVLMAVATTERAEAKRVVVPKMYIYGFAASFTDTVVYFTNVMEVDSAWYETKSKFLLGRNLYSRQLRNFLEKEKKEQLDVIIAEEHLKPAETGEFMQRAFADGYVTETGTGIAKILPPSNPFLPESGEKKQTVIEKLKEYLNKFLNTNE